MIREKNKTKQKGGKEFLDVEKQRKWYIFVACDFACDFVLNLDTSFVTEVCQASLANQQTR